MRIMSKAALAALALAGAAAAATPAAAQQFGLGFGPNGGISFSVDSGGYCDQFGCPDDFWDMPVYYGPVFYAGQWYDGPVYYRDGRRGREYWIHGNWRRDEWRGPHPGWWREGRYGPALGMDYYRQHNFHGRWGGGDRGPNFGPRGDDRGGSFGHRGDDRGANFGPRGDDHGSNFGPRGDDRGENFGHRGDDRGANFGPRGDDRGGDRGQNFGPRDDRGGNRQGFNGPQNGPANNPPANQPGAQGRPQPAPPANVAPGNAPRAFDPRLGRSQRWGQPEAAPAAPAPAAQAPAPAAAPPADNGDHHGRRDRPQQ